MTESGLVRELLLPFPSESRVLLPDFRSLLGRHLDRLRELLGLDDLDRARGRLTRLILEKPRGDVSNPYREVLWRTFCSWGGWELSAFYLKDFQTPKVELTEMKAWLE